MAVTFNPGALNGKNNDLSDFASALYLRNGDPIYDPATGQETADPDAALYGNAKYGKTQAGFDRWASENSKSIQRASSDANREQQRKDSNDFAGFSWSDWATAASVAAGGYLAAGAAFGGAAAGTAAATAAPAAASTFTGSAIGDAALTGAAKGAVISGITGGNPITGAIGGAVGGGVGGALGGGIMGNIAGSVAGTATSGLINGAMTDTNTTPSGTATAPTNPASTFQPGSVPDITMSFSSFGMPSDYINKGPSFRGASDVRGQ